MDVIFQLKELIEEYDDGTCDDGGSGPEGRHVRIENKNFFFSCKKNAQVMLYEIFQVEILAQVNFNGPLENICTLWHYL